jgi:polyhydroxybutyrate depolymerase
VANRRIRLVGALAAAVVVVLAAVPAFAGCDGTPGATGTIELKTGAITRTFVVRVPQATGVRKPAPVIFLFHPFGMNSQYMQGRVPMPRVWPEAIAVYPQGMPRAGAVGFGFQPAWQTALGEMDDRDLVFFDQMLEWMRANHCVDDSRVFVMGYSNGARLASLLACERAGVIAGIAIASGSLSCAPPEARPIILSHGLVDATIPYARAVEASKTWAGRNACTAPPRTGAVGCAAADACSAAPVTLCSYEGGHEYWEPFTRAVADFLKNVSLKPHP